MIQATNQLLSEYNSDQNAGGISRSELGVMSPEDTWTYLKASGMMAKTV